MKKTRSIVTENEKACFFCGRPAECEHHLIFGSGSRESFRARYGKSYL